jgi:predicted nuclease with TOPRIM domain
MSDEQQLRQQLDEAHVERDALLQRRDQLRREVAESKAKLERRAFECMLLRAELAALNLEGPKQ